MSLEGHDAETSSSGNMPKLSYAADLSSSSVEPVEKSYLGTEGHVNGKIGGNGPPNPVVEKKTAKIHDFCLGIPFGKCMGLEISYCDCLITTSARYTCTIIIYHSGASRLCTYR